MFPRCIHMFAFGLQLQLVRRLPFCLAALLGTHNSAITLADGYGNRDVYFQQYFKWIRWVVGAWLIASQSFSERLLDLICFIAWCMRSLLCHAVQQFHPPHK